MLQILDAHWREHLAALDHLRQGIHLRGYAQKNPKQEYKREAFELFGAMLEAVKLEVIKILNTVEIRSAEEPPPIDDKPHVENVRLQHADYDEALAGAADAGRGREHQSRRSPSCASRRKSAATIPVPAGRARSSSTATGNWPEWRSTCRLLIRHRCIPFAGVELGVAMAGIKKPNRKDLLVMRLAPGAVVAGVFTQNRFCAAPVVLAKKHLKNSVRALVVNTGNANAGTGRDGLTSARMFVHPSRSNLAVKAPRSSHFPPA